MNCSPRFNTHPMGHTVRSCILGSLDGGVLTRRMDHRGPVAVSCSRTGNVRFGGLWGVNFVVPVCWREFLQKIASPLRPFFVLTGGSEAACGDSTAKTFPGFLKGVSARFPRFPRRLFLTRGTWAPSCRGGVVFLIFLTHEL